MSLFKKKPVDNRAFVAFQEMMAVTGRTSASFAKISGDLLLIGAKVSDDPTLVEILLRSQRELADATADMRAVVDKVVKVLGVKDHG
jgi:hypothetical protein